MEKIGRGGYSGDSFNTHPNRKRSNRITVKHKENRNNIGSPSISLISNGRYTEGLGGNTVMTKSEKSGHSSFGLPVTNEKCAF